MDFRLFRLKWLPLLAVAAVVAMSSFGSQPVATNAWQPIIFSSPSNTETPSNLTLQVTQPATPPTFQSMLRSFQNASPVTTFGNLPAAPPPRQIFILGRAQRPSKPADNNRDWEFMTPAEILGVAPNQILPTPGWKANGNQSSLTPIERYFERQNPSTRMRGNSSGNSSPEQNFWAGGGDQTNDTASALFGSGPVNFQSTIFNSALNNAPNGNLFAGPNGNSDWSKLFGSLLPSAPTPNLAQQQQQQQQRQADMDQFKQLLNPSFTPVTMTTSSSDKTPLLQPQITRPFSDDSTAPLADPIGASFAPLSSGIGKPASLAPLPTTTRQATVQLAAPPAWAPQPPWLSPTPQPFAVPQRKF